MYSNSLPIFSSFQCKLSVEILYKTKFTKNVSQILGASGTQAVENLRIISSAAFVHDHLITKVVVEKFNKIF